jgi:hypothetical protein
MSRFAARSSNETLDRHRPPAPHRVALSVRQLTGYRRRLGECLARACVVRQPERPVDTLRGLLGALDQVLEADQHVADSVQVGERRLHDLPPGERTAEVSARSVQELAPSRRPQRRPLVAAELDHQRPGHVATVPDHVDEPRLGEHGAQERHPQAVARIVGEQERRPALLLGRPASQRLLDLGGGVLRGQAIGSTRPGRQGAPRPARLLHGRDTGMRVEDPGQDARPGPRAADEEHGTGAAQPVRRVLGSRHFRRFEGRIRTHRDRCTARPV